MNLAAVALLALVFGLLFYDWASTQGGRRARRMLLLEAVVFCVAFFIAFPDAATAVAHRVGIGRGVDFILYPLVIWLVRESLLNRRRRWEDGSGSPGSCGRRRSRRRWRWGRAPGRTGSAAEGAPLAAARWTRLMLGMAPRIHHLDCTTLCPASAALINDGGAIFQRGRMVCHCLLIEGDDGLVLVDTGLGTEDLADPERRLGRAFTTSSRRGGRSRAPRSTGCARWGSRRGTCATSSPPTSTSITRAGSPTSPTPRCTSSRPSTRPR